MYNSVVDPEFVKGGFVKRAKMLWGATPTFDKPHLPYARNLYSSCLRKSAKRLLCLQNQFPTSVSDEDSDTMNSLTILLGFTSSVVLVWLHNFFFFY